MKERRIFVNICNVVFDRFNIFFHVLSGFSDSNGGNSTGDFFGSEQGHTLNSVPIVVIKHGYNIA
jgi:hypothetical protein